MGAVNNIIDTSFEFQIRLELSTQLVTKVLVYGCSLDMIIREKEFRVTGV